MNDLTGPGSGSYRCLIGHTVRLQCITVGRRYSREVARNDFKLAIGVADVVHSNTELAL